VIWCHSFRLTTWEHTLLLSKTYKHTNIKWEFLSMFQLLIFYQIHRPACSAHRLLLRAQSNASHKRSLAIAALLGSATHPKHTYVQNFKPPSLLKISIKTLSTNICLFIAWLAIREHQSPVSKLSTWWGCCLHCTAWALELWLCTPTSLMQNSATKLFPWEFSRTWSVFLSSKRHHHHGNILGPTTHSHIHDSIGNLSIPSP